MMKQIVSRSNVLYEKSDMMVKCPLLESEIKEHLMIKELLKK